MGGHRAGGVEAACMTASQKAEPPIAYLDGSVRVASSIESSSARSQPQGMDARAGRECRTWSA